MAIKRYKRVGTTMIERSKGPWVLWEDIKDWKPPDKEVKKDGKSSNDVNDRG